MRRFLAVALAAALVLSFAAPALAGKGGNHGKPIVAAATILGPLDPVTYAPTTAIFGSVIAFASDADQSQYPWVEVQARVNGTLVYSMVKGIFVQGVDGDHPTFTLGPTSVWSGGPADGSATLFLMTPNSGGVGRTILATLTFPIGG